MSYSHQCIVCFINCYRLIRIFLPFIINLYQKSEIYMYTPFLLIVFLYISLILFNFHTVSLMSFLPGYVSFAHAQSVGNSYMNMFFHELYSYTMKYPYSHSLSSVFLWQTSSSSHDLTCASESSTLNFCYGEYWFINLDRPI